MNVEDPTIHGVKAEEVPGAYSKDAPVGTTAFIMKEDSSKCMKEDGASGFLGDAEICKEEGCGQRDVEAGSLKQQQVVEGSRSLASMIEGAGHARPATILAGAGGAGELAVEVVGLRPCDEAETGLTSSVIDGTLPSDSLRVKASLGDCSQDTVCPDTSLDEEASKNEHDGPRDSATACPAPEKDVLMDFATSCPVTSLAEEASNPKKEGPRHSAFEPAHHSACLMEGTSPGSDHQTEKSADPSLFGNTQVRASLTVEAVRRLVAKHHFRKSGTVQPVTGQLTAQVPTPGFSAPKVNVSEEENDPSGRCCICNDERSWHNNLLVYCDGGPACKVAVHQGCYGIVKVPEGPWFCRKCESQERAAKVKCELCPQKVGALKRTDTGGWAHVVCALYIPEVDFACTATMEPILLKYVPRDRFTKVCYLCHIEGRESKGACMTCNAPKCAKAFHATCAQSAGLLCAERGTGSETLKYCGYCKEHLVQLGLFSKNGKKVPSHRKKEYYEKKVLDAKQRGKEQNKMCEPGHSSNPVCSSFKRNEDSACQMSAVHSKCISATDGNGAVKITNSVRKWKRKRSQEHNQETVAGTMGKRKKMKQAGCAESVVQKKGKVSKAVSNRCKPLKTKRPLHSQLPVSIVPTDYSCADDTIMQQVLPVVTMNDDLQKLKSTSAEKSTKSMLKNRRPHNKIINDKNTSKIFRGKAKVAKPQSPNVKISSTQQPSAAVPKKGRPQKKLAKDVNLQASPPIPKSLQAGPKNGNALNTIVSSTIQHKLASSKINPVHKRKRKDSCSNLHKLPRKALPAMPKSVNKKKLSAKGASLQKAGRPRSSTVSVKYPSVKGVYRKKSHLTLPKSANSQSRNMEVGSLTLSPAVPKYVCLKNLYLNSGNLKSSSAESKTDQSQEPSVKYDGFQNNGSTPAPNLDATVPSGLSFRDLSFNNISGDSRRKCVLQHNLASMRSPGESKLSYGKSGMRLSEASLHGLQDNVSLDQLLERQWNEGHEFLLEHGTFSDVMGILNSLHQLQMENKQLDEKIRRLVAEKERLQLMKCQLSFPFTARTSKLSSSHVEALTAQEALDTDSLTVENNHHSGACCVPKNYLLSPK